MDAAAVVGQYLSSLDASASLVRQRRWALTGLLEHAETALGRPATLAELLAPAAVGAWLAQVAGGDRPASTAGLRARAAAVRALAAFTGAHALTSPGPGPGPLPAPAPASVDIARGKGLLVMAADAPPCPVRPRAWARFAAHVHVLAVTGAPERVTAALTTADVDATGRGIRAPGWTDLPDPAARAVQRWLDVRAGVVAGLGGAAPAALWVTVGPGRDGRPAGLPVTARGLRKAFSAVVADLARVEPELAGASVKDLRAVATTWGVPIATAS